MPPLAYYGATLKTQHQASAAKQAERVASPSEKIAMLEDRKAKLGTVRDGLVTKLKDIEGRIVARGKREEGERGESGVEGSKVTRVL